MTATTEPAKTPDQQDFQSRLDKVNAQITEFYHSFDTNVKLFLIGLGHVAVAVGKAAPALTEAAVLVEQATGHTDVVAQTQQAGQIASTVGSTIGGIVPEDVLLSHAQS